MIRFDDILEKVSSRLTERDIVVLQKAYVFSAKAHRGQVRRSGEPYLSHPLEVANLLADMNMDRTTLVAGLLHDVLEDTEVTPAELKDAFGKDVAALVSGVTKISRVQDASPDAHRAETIRKIILAMIDDLRVIFIKLADRLHNLKTLKFLPEEKQRQIAAETLEIYAPIANRLGMGRIRAELEDLAFRYVERDEFFHVASLVEPRRKKAEAELRKFKATLEKLMKENHIPAEIYYRIKRPYSIYRKMKAQHVDFNQVYDFLALRIITDSVKNCYAALGIIHQKWPPIPNRFRDFIAMPKPNLYQALHTTIITEGKQSFEIQIRTREMHNLAENGIAAHWKYKEDDAQSLLKEDSRLEWLREMVELFREQKNPKEFLKSLKINLIPEEAYVFTPKGQVVTLPIGASALDFAFRIHTEIGLHATAAKINAKPAPLKTLLKTGDIVEILTSPEKFPTRGWLNIAFTSGARHHLKRWLNQQEKIKSVALGRKLWEKEARKYAWPAGLPQENRLIERLRRAVKAKVPTLDDFFALAGRGKIVINRKFLERVFPEGLVPKAKSDEKGGPEIQVKDRSRELVHLAKCCAPIKGEPIIGYITSGKGITVHALRCTFIAKEILAPERMVDVSWGDVVQDYYQASLSVRTASEPGILAKVATAISELEGDIVRAEVETAADGKGSIEMCLTVRDIKHLEAIMKRIREIEGIQALERV
jgi:guanosine-3',5'-bis(diphosphate) 3'-pyrophosphohydrolase